MEKIKVVVKKVGEDPAFEEVDNSLESLQKLVGGYIQAVPVTRDVTLICNEDGKFMGLPRNCRVGWYELVGDILFIGTKRGDFADVPLTEDEFKKMFRNLYKEA